MSEDSKNSSGTNWLLVGVIFLIFPVIAFTIIFISEEKRPYGLTDKYGIEAVEFESSGKTQEVKSKIDKADKTEKTVSENINLKTENSDKTSGNLSYKFEDWDPKLIEFYEVGPNLLARDVNFELPNPPADNSAETKAELDLLREYAKTRRTPEEIRKIKYEAYLDRPAQAFEYAGLFIFTNNKDADELLRVAEEDLRFFLLKAKKKFARIRPSVLAPDLELVVENPGHPAYPSGHAAQGYMGALILTTLDPEHEKEYKKFGYNIGLRREIAGVHYPSDSRAGRKLAEEVFEKLKTVPKFKKLLDKAVMSYKPAYFPNMEPSDSSKNGSGGKENIGQ